MFEVTTDRSAILKKAINRLFALLVVLSIPITTLVIQSCGDEDDLGQGSEIAEGFRAELYINGELATDGFATGFASLTGDLLTYADMDIHGSAQDHTIHIRFHSKNLSGIDDYTPGALNTTNFGEPTFELISFGESIVWSYIGQSETSSSSGEIIKIDRQRVAGNFNAKDKNNAWEIRNCEFNVEVTGGS